jgi:hypothetical protein
MNQVVEAVIGSNHPPFTTDPCIVEFIQREAETLAEKAHKEAVLQAKRNARQAYDTAREEANALHNKDLKTIREHTDKALAEARAKSKIKIAAFKADLKAQRLQCKADLEQDAILARRTPKKPRPDLGICSGGPACTGLRSGWSWPRPRAEISPPEHHPCPCLGLSGFFRTRG